MWKTFIDDDDEDLIIIQDNPEELEEINSNPTIEKTEDFILNTEKDKETDDLFEFSVDDIKEESLKDITTNWTSDFNINPTEVKEELSDDLDLFWDDSEISKPEVETAKIEKIEEDGDFDLFWDDSKVEEKIEEIEKTEKLEEEDLEKFGDLEDSITTEDVLEPLVISSVLAKTISELRTKWEIDEKLKIKKQDKKTDLETKIKDLQTQVRELNKEIKEIEEQEVETKKVINNLEKMQNDSNSKTPRTNNRRK